MTHTNPSPIGAARPDEPADALTLCWAGAAAGGVERRALVLAMGAFAIDGLPYAPRRDRPPLVRWAETQEAA